MDKRINMEFSKSEVEQKSQEVVEASTIHAEKVEEVRQMQIMHQVREGLEDFFEGRKAKGRFIDIDRIPFICDDIADIKVSIDKINDLIWRFIMAMLGLLILILLGLGGWAFTILVHVANN